MKERDRDAVTQPPWDMRALLGEQSSPDLSQPGSWKNQNPGRGGRKRGRTDPHPRPHHRLADLRGSELEETKGLPWLEMKPLGDSTRRLSQSGAWSP